MNLSDAQIAMLAGAKVVVVAPSGEKVYASKIGYPVSANFSADEVDPAALYSGRLHRAC
jgi:hypothetical protein